MVIFSFYQASFEDAKQAFRSSHKDVSRITPGVPIFQTIKVDRSDEENTELSSQSSLPSTLKKANNTGGSGKGIVPYCQTNSVPSSSKENVSSDQSRESSLSSSNRILNKVPIRGGKLDRYFNKINGSISTIASSSIRPRKRRTKSVRVVNVPSESSDSSGDNEEPDWTPSGKGRRRIAKQRSHPSKRATNKQLSEVTLHNNEDSEEIIVDSPVRPTGGKKISKNTIAPVTVSSSSSGSDSDDYASSYLVSDRVIL